TFSSLTPNWNIYAAHYRPSNRVEETNSPIGRIFGQLFDYCVVFYISRAEPKPRPEYEFE
ncbi:hypothetical protein LRP52_48960, partial [Photobacterium sp. ZSDE20]|nr:hypothetical protein [Photobacterium sp. ZSDE20]